MIVLTLIGWTSIPNFLRWFKNDIDPWTANGWRYGFSALMWLPVLLLAWRRNTLPPGLFKKALIPSFFNIFAQICFGIAPYYVSPGLMTFSMRIQIIFVTLGAVIMFPAERRVIRTPGYIIGAIMVVGGTLAVILFKEGGIAQSGTLPNGDNPLLGIGLSVSAGLLYAGYALAVRKFMHGLPAFTAFSAVSQYTGAALVLAMLLFGDRMGMTLLDLSGFKIGMVLLSAIIGIGLGHTLYYASISRLGLAVSSGVVQLQPITVSLVAWWLLGEQLTPLQWITGVIAIIGAGIILVTQHRMARQVAISAEPAD